DRRGLVRRRRDRPHRPGGGRPLPARPRRCHRRLPFHRPAPGRGRPAAPLRFPPGTRRQRSPMNPNTVFSASLVTSLVLWFPSMQACLRGDLDLSAAGLRYVAALIVARLAVNGLARLVNTYRAAQTPEPPASAAP